MIVVASLGTGEVSAREWFDRAIDAQIDYAPAYAAYVDSLRPVNGGSILAMYRFAKECLDSALFGSDVPLWYARTLQRIQREIENPREAWASRGVDECLRRLFDGYAAKKRPTLGENALDSGRCVLAWAGGRYADALAAWGKAGKRLDPQWFPLVGQEDATLVEADLRYLETHPEAK